MRTSTRTRPEPPNPPTPVRALAARALTPVALASTVLAAIALAGCSEETVPEEVTSTTTAPAPTADNEPVPWPTESPLLRDLPDTWLTYALADVAEAEVPAVESWDLTYADSSGEIHLKVAQWSSPEAASEHLTQFAGDEVEGTDPVQLGEVEAGGEAVGEAVLWELGDGEGRLVWQNSTVLLRLDGPGEEVEELYRAFPL